MTLVHVRNVLVEDEIRTLLVDSVVSEMHELVVQVLGTRRTVLLSSKTSQSLLIDKDPQRVDT